MGELDQTRFGRWAARSEAEERLERLVRGLTYQDGWTFALTRSGGGTPWLTVEWELDDVEEPGRRTLLAGGVEFRAEYGGDDALRHFLFGVWEMIGRLEAHERIERLRFDDEPLWDPHPPRSRGESLVCAPDHMAPLPELREAVR